MKFDSKAHMAQELAAGKRFKSTKTGHTAHFDPNLNPPFRYADEALDESWNAWHIDIWEEIKPSHVHQDLIDSYQEGQAWQVEGQYDNCWANIQDSSGSWVIPKWVEEANYRIHPHNDLIQAYKNGAKIQAFAEGSWCDEDNPVWFEDWEYRIKPATKTVYEWISKSNVNAVWHLDAALVTENEAKALFGDLEHRKTGRSWEVEE